MRYDGASLPRAVGRDGPEGSRIADGRAGHLCYGPYFTLGAGRYVAGYYVRRLPGSAPGFVDCDVMAAGDNMLAHKSVPAESLFEDALSFVTLEFTADDRAERTEVRLHVAEGVLVEVSELVVFSRRARNWGGQ
jgi:hypothetical protein